MHVVILALSGNRPYITKIVVPPLQTTSETTLNEGHCSIMQIDDLLRLTLFLCEYETENYETACNSNMKQKNWEGGGPHTLSYRSLHIY